MLHLTNQLLDFRKIQNNKMILKIREIDICRFYKRDIREFSVPLAIHKGITFTLNSDFRFTRLYADPGKLDIIIYNIISNAIKFTGTGKSVSVMITESEKPNSIYISVTDEGPGIPQKNLSDIFTRYTILSSRDLGRDRYRIIAFVRTCKTARRRHSFILDRWAGEAHLRSGF